MKKISVLTMLMLSLAWCMNATAASQAGIAAIKAGNILHCFDWKYSDIQAELENIKAAGFVAVQTSVAQKNYGGAQDWSAIYRPWDTTVGNGLGSANDLQALCTAAHAKGLYVIVDVVANHTDGYGDGPEPYQGMADFWKNKDLYHNNGGANDGSRFQVTHGHIGMPDLKTEDPRVQAKFKDYVQLLKGYGVDGLRWDAAKHIGLPSEGDQFWPNVIDKDMFNYGEILNTTGGDNTKCLKEYHNYMSVTDNQYSTNQILGAFKSGNVPNNGGCWTNDTGSDKFVYWGESHDTFLNSGDASENVNQDVIDRAYAVAAAYNNIPGLYLSRPNKPAKVGIKGSMNFKNSWVAQVNLMKNRCKGEPAVFGQQNGACSVTRKSGAVIVKGNGSGNVTVPNGGGNLAAGTYKDKVSGNTFTVTSSTISGNVGSNGIAVIYKDGTAPDPDPTPDPEPEPQPTPGPDQPSDDETICLENATDNVVFFQNTEGWSTAYVYVWYGKNPATEIAGKWPGTEMTKVGEKYYKFALPTTPEDNWMIIFNNGSGTQTKDLNLQNRHVYKLDGNSEEVVVLCEELMGVEELEYQQTTHVSKTVIDGHLLITIDGHVYDVTGTLLR